MLQFKFIALVIFSYLSLSSFAQDEAHVRVKHGTDCDTLVTLVQLRALPRHTAVITTRDGEEEMYEGAFLKQVLELNCPSIAAIDKRSMTRSYVRIMATDGYSAIVALTEADTTFREHPVLLVWQKNGAALTEHDGPLQMIVPDDKRHSRNVRKVSSVEVITP